MKLGRPERAKPADFRQVFARLGWEHTPDHYGASWRVVKRWYDSEPGIAEERRAFRARRRNNYVMGRRLSSVKLKSSMV